MLRYFKLFYLASIVLKWIAYILLALSIYTMINPLINLASPTNSLRQVKIEVKPTGTASLAMNLDNPSLLELATRIRIELVSSSDRIVREDSLNLPPGEKGVMNLSITLTPNQMIEFAINQPKILITVNTTTLGGLTGMEFNMRGRE
jgi:hypothetical protein